MAPNLGSEAAGLRWIDESPKVESAPRPMTLLDEGNTLRSRLKTKLMDNLLVPFGLIATATCLTMGLYNMQRGDKIRQQMYMRGRVGFQLFTIVAMVTTLAINSRKSKRQSSGTTD